MQFKFTTATTGEREVLDEFLGKIQNCIVVADAGYVSKELNLRANENGNLFYAAVRKNMKTLATIWQNKCMNMRSRVESVFGELKERCKLVTSLPRSVSGYLAHYIRCLFGYMLLG
jgi:Transposase DDE domain